MNGKLFINEDTENGSFIYTPNDGKDVYLSIGLSGLINHMKTLDYKTLQKKPNYQSVKSDDIKIIEGAREKFLEERIYDPKY
tara:strand:+ start:315 stop:560 length:246 start_codon:yes stop_codon:yes gene_type:complete